MIIESSKIYGKGSTRVLTPYETAVNESSAKLALEDPSLLIKRDVLYEKAKEVVRSDTSFSFKKGKSRSTLSGLIDEEKPAKRKYTTDSYRKEHITKLTEDIDGKQKQMKFKMLHQSKAQSSKDWETCDKIQKEMNTIRQEIHKCQQELQLLQRKESKSKWYKKSKKCDDGEESTTADGKKQRSLFQSLNQGNLKEKGEKVETGGKREADPQETRANERETCCQTQIANEEGQGFRESPL